MELRLTKAPGSSSRIKLPESLRGQEIVIEPVADITYLRMGEKITEVLEYEPSELFVKKYVRPTYALSVHQGVVIGELPSCLA